MKSERVEEYLEAISKRQQAESPVTTSSLAADLEVSLPAVTDMMHRLSAQGLIDYAPNKGAVLTAEGQRMAMTTIRRHRLWERFLTDILGLKWDNVHEEACRLEHATSAETEDRLASLIGEADTCPHGHPIPDRDGRVADRGLRRLSEFAPGQLVCISAIGKEYPALLRRVEKRGLRPGTMVRIEEKADDGAMVLDLDGRSLTLEPDMASDLLVRLEEGPSRPPAEVPVALSGLKAGETAFVNSYSGGRAMLGRCLSMGFTPGSTVRMLENYGKGPMLVNVCDSEVALGRGIADKIMVVRKKNR